MKWIEASIIAAKSGVEYVEAKLLASGVDGWQIIDYEEMRSFLAENPLQWDYIDERLLEGDPGYVTIKFYVSDDKTGNDMIETVNAGLGILKNSKTGVNLGTLTISLEQVDDENWLDDWKKFFKPIEIGSKIVIKPAWEEYAESGKIVVDIDPGYVFGTGQHETTRLCIEALERCIKPRDMLLDLGCGSGILSVTGILLGAEKCIAVDINPIAADITYQNALINGISGERLQVLVGDIIKNQRLQEQVRAQEYDCIAANIVADAIISLSALIPEMKCLKPEGVFIASGIINERLDDVVSALKDAGFVVTETATAGQWSCVTACGTRAVPSFHTH